MHLYQGVVWKGEPQVMCDGKPLKSHCDIVNHSPSGFAWGYQGSGPAQLALAIMCTEYGEELDAHPCHYQDLKRHLIAGLETDKPFQLSSADIDAVVQSVRKACS